MVVIYHCTLVYAYFVASAVVVVGEIITKTRPCNILKFFLAVKMKHWKNFDIFLIFAQNIDCGYTLEPPRRHNLCTCFGANN